MLRIVTDDAADMPRAWQGEYDIQVVPVANLGPGTVGIVFFPYGVNL